MSIRIMSQVFERSKTKLAARLVLLALADNASDEGYCYPSIATIAKKAGVGEETTGEYLKAFEKIGLVEHKDRFTKEGRQTSNGYQINVDKIGQDEISSELIASCRPQSQQKRGKLTRQGGGTPHPPSPPTPPTPSGDTPHPPESSFKPSLEDEEEDDGNLTPHQKGVRMCAILEKRLHVQALPAVQDDIFELSKKISLAFFRVCVDHSAKRAAYSWAYVKTVIDNGGPSPDRRAPAQRPPAPRKGKPTPRDAQQPTPGRSAQDLMAKFFSAPVIPQIEAPANGD